MKHDDGNNRRLETQRKPINEVDVVNVKDLKTGEVYFARATILDVSATGLLLSVKRENILTLSLRSHLTLNPIVNAGLGFTIEVMDTYIEGVVTRTRPEGRGDFSVAVDFREDAPEYWRNCLVDLLPGDDGDMT